MRSGFAKLSLGQGLRLGVAAGSVSLWRTSR